VFYLTAGEVDAVSEQLGGADADEPTGSVPWT
jgi:hypothetical protein